MSFTQAPSHIRVSGTRSLASGTPPRFHAHILILLTNFSPSGGFSHPLFLLLPRSLTNPMKADSRTKIRLQRLDFRSRRRRHSPNNCHKHQRSVWSLPLTAAGGKEVNTVLKVHFGFLHFPPRVSVVTNVSPIMKAAAVVLTGSGSSPATTDSSLTGTNLGQAHADCQMCANQLKRRHQPSR